MLTVRCPCCPLCACLRACLTQAAAKRAVESHRNVPEKLSLAELRADVLRVLATAQRHCLPMPSS